MVEQVSTEAEARSHGIRIAEGHLALLYRQLADGLASGLPLPDAVRLIARESHRRHTRVVMQRIWEDIQAGLTLAEAMCRFPATFSSLHRAVVRAGEDANSLEDAVAQLAEQTRATTHAAHQLTLAMIYPVAVSVLALSMMTFLCTFIVPKFMAMFKDLGVREMPALTQALVGLSGVWPVLLAFLISSVVLLYIVYTYARARQGSIVADRWKMRLPLLGPYFAHLAEARLAGTLAVMVRHGDSLPEALRMTARAVGDRRFEAALRRAARLVEEGEPLSEALQRSGGTSAELAARVSVAESTGTVPEALHDVAKYHLQCVEGVSRQFWPILEPLLVLVIGICVGTIAVGMFMPLLAVVNSLSGGGS
ncbi:MAG: Type II secretion system protein F [Alphaproteobacteria bacterium ADurb.BinA305]|nr:MAG: Type II secretion system protein F [Alphaproteobacteria bacterium ADurb.BinA305]